MRTPICAICGRNFSRRLRCTGKGGDVVEFTDDEPLQPNVVGHPHGLLWICTSHRTEALAATHLDAEVACAGIRQALALPAVVGDAPDVGETELWIVHAGLALGQVIGLVRTLTNETATELRERMRAGRFAVCAGEYTDLVRWQRELEALGATCEIRFNDGLDGFALRRLGAVPHVTRAPFASLKRGL